MSNDFNDLARMHCICIKVHRCRAKSMGYTCLKVCASKSTPKGGGRACASAPVFPPWGEGVATDIRKEQAEGKDRMSKSQGRHDGCPFSHSGGPRCLGRKRGGGSLARVQRFTSRPHSHPKIRAGTVSRNAAPAASMIQAIMTPPVRVRRTQLVCALRRYPGLRCRTRCLARWSCDPRRSGLQSPCRCARPFRRACRRANR